MDTEGQITTKHLIQLSPLQEVHALVESHLEKLLQFVQNEKLSILSFKHSAVQEREIDIGLNVFQLVSDTYYKENFHSDVLQALLDPCGLHKEGSLFLHSFISFINEHQRKGWLRKEDYQNAIVEREAGRIDISVKDVKSKKAIIIENKINGAVDMGRQIPRYVEHLEKQGYEIDLIVYLVLSGNKQPNTYDWSQTERDTILPKVYAVAAYDETPADLHNGWLTKCERQIQNIDTLFLLRQYNNLISYLGGKNMNKPLMEEFLQNMLIDDNYNKAVSLNAMLQDLISYRRNKIIDTFKFNSSPFTKVFDWKNYAVLDSYIINDTHYAIDIIVEQDRYRFQFFVRAFGDKNNTTNPSTTFLQDSHLIDSFFAAGERWEKQFLFPSQEDELYQFISEFKNKLKEYTTAINIIERQD